MALQNGLFTLALSALMMAPVAAQARDMRSGGAHGANPVGAPRVEHRITDYRPIPQQPSRVERTGWYRHEGPYVVQRPGYYEQFRGERTCLVSPYRYQTRCVPSHVEQRWGPGYSYGVWAPAYPGRYYRY